jgi:PAS domain S-box-containing protein
MLPTDENFAQLRRNRQVEVFRAQLLAAGAANMFNATLLAGVYLGAAPFAVVASWWAVTALIAARTVFVGFRQRKRQYQQGTSVHTLKRIEVATWITGLVWGIGAAALFPFGSLAEQLLLAFVVGGTAAGAAAGLNAIPRASNGFVLLSLAPIFVWFVALGEDLRIVMAAMMLAFVTVLILFTRESNRSFLRATQLQLDAAQQSALLTAIAAVQTTFIASRDFKAAFSHLLDEAMRNASGQAALIAEFGGDDSGHLRVLAARKMTPETPENLAADAHCYKILKSPFVDQILQGVETVVATAPFSESIEGFDRFTNAIGVALTGRNGPQGVLIVANRSTAVASDQIDQSIPAVAASILSAQRIRRARRAEQAAFAELAASNTIILDSVTEGVLTVDQAGIVVQSNDAAKRLFGEPSLSGAAIRPLIPDWKSADPLDLSAAAHGQRKDGSSFPATVSVGSANNKGAPIYVLTVQDLTARQDLQAELERFFSSSLDLFFVAGLDGFFRFNNQAWSRILGIEPSELLSRPFIDFVHPDDRAATMEENQKLASGGYEVSEFENRFIGKDGKSRWFVWNVTANPPVGRIYGVGRDVTDRRNLDQMKSDFISLVSHELRTPLTSINASLGLIDDGMVEPSSADAGELVSIARNNSDRLVRLVSDILDLQKIDDANTDGSDEPSDLVAAVERSCQEIQSAAHQQGVSVVCRIDSEFRPTVPMHQDRIQQVMANLLSNAVKYSPQGQEVVCMVASSPIASMVRVSVKDSGTGVPEEFQGQLFERFARADNEENKKLTGTGLGLSICKALAEGAGGTISFANDPIDGGATFHVDLPITTDG